MRSNYSIMIGNRRRTATTPGLPSLQLASSMCSRRVWVGLQSSIARPHSPASILLVTTGNSRADQH
jgi:hypothetical protein